MSANKTFVLGLTGGIGCGKSAAAQYLASLGAAHIDADAISRALTAPGGAALPEIRKAFGDGVFMPDGTLNRAALAQIVFADGAQRAVLEGVVHPRVRAEVLAEIAASRAPVTVLDAPLLFEAGLDALCDTVWSMSLGAREQLERVCVRDGLTRAQAQARIDSQLSMAARNARAARVIDSGRPIEETRAELARLYRALPVHNLESGR